jgi:Tol biopolymer transport system component
MSLFEEFKRRKVFRLAAAYVVVAWLLIQVVDVIKEPLNLPEWFHTVVIVLVGLMFPVALMLSWAYDVTPEGVVKEDGSRTMPVRVDYGKIALAAVIVLGAFLAGNLVTDTNMGQVLRVAGTDQPSTTSPVRIPWQPETWDGVISPGHPAFSMAMSPAGDVLAYVERDPSGVTGLRIRHLDRLNSTRLPGTEGAEMPFFSADGQWVGYIDDGVMKRVSIDGGDPSVITVIESGETYGASWGADGTIVFAETGTSLKSVSASGGGFVDLTELDASRNEYSHRLPSFVPGHDLLLFSVFANFRHEVWALDLATGERRYLFDGLSARFVFPGHIVYAKMETGAQGSLWAVPFDTDQMAVTGTPQLIQGAVSGREGSAFASGHTGPIVYFPSQGELLGELVLVEADGTLSVLRSGPLFTTPVFSSDGRRIAVGEFDPLATGLDLYIVDVATGSPQLIHEGGVANPLWSPDDKAIYYSSGGVGLVKRSLDGTNSTEVLAPSTERTSTAPSDWIDGGRTLVLGFTYNPPSDWDIYSLQMDGQSQPRLLIDHELPSFPSITADGRWVAFCTWPRGVIVGNFPDLTYEMSPSKTGCSPRWGPSDEHLYFQQANKLWRIPTEIGDTITFGETQLVADLGIGTARAYDIDQDGRLVLARRYFDSPKPPVVLGNWRSTLSRQD